MQKEITTKFQSIWRRGIIKYQNWKQRNFIKSSKLMYWMALILVAKVVADRVGNKVGLGRLGSFLVIIGCIILGAIIQLIAGWIITLSLKNGVEEFISALMISGVAISGVTYFTFRLASSRVVVIGVVIGAIFILFLKSLWSLCVGRLNTKFNIGVVLIGGGLIILSIWFLNTQGFEDTYIKTYLNLDKDFMTLTGAEAESFKNSIAGGSYTVLSSTYDISNADIFSKTVNLTGYASQSGALGYIKKRYQGYDLDAVPIRGKIWYPKEVGHCPTLFIVHGNHDYREESYLGYQYLGEYLAAYGYVVVSVDENACNFLNNENDARAILLLENIATVLEYNNTPNNLIYQKIDEERLALAGHSRGGEAISIAYLFNHEAVNPNNGTMHLNYHFNIKGLIAIAPTIDQYKPTNKSVVLEDVNYLIIHGSNDQDLYNFSGMKQYKNIHFTGKGDYIKSALYCAGCNHGQFNSRWGLYDQTGFYTKVLNVKNFVSESEQQRIAEIFIKTFLDCSLREDTSHRGLLEDYHKYKAYLPQTLYVQSYQHSDFKVLCNFEEDTSLVTGSLEGVTLDVQGGNIWTEGLYPTEAMQSNSAIYLKWENGLAPTLIVNMSPMNMNHRAVQFDIMNLREDFEEAQAKLLEARIQVVDRNNQMAEVSLRDCAIVYPAFLVRLNKLQYVLDEKEYKHQFQTVSVQSEQFKANNSQIDMSQIVAIRLAFTEQEGIVVIDEIGYA